MAAISLHGVHRVHPDGTAALVAVDLDVADGELVGVIGPSGSGKSTLVRVVAGLEPLADGVVRIGGRDMAGVSTRSREVALIAQSQTLYAFLDVAENLAFPLELRRTPGEEAARRTAAERRAFGLGRIWHRRPRTLSAGDAQRTALARAMVRLPRALLADEPLQLLDPPSAARLRREVHRLQRATGMTTVWTGNHQAEVLGIADRVAVLRAGRVEQVGTPASLLAAPRTRWVAGFVGEPAMTFVRAVVVEEGGVGRLLVGDQRVRVPGGLPGALRSRVGAAVDVGGRPGDVRAVRPGDPVDMRLTGVVAATRPLGREDQVTVELPTGRLAARFPPGSRLRPGARVEVHLDVRRMSAFDPATGGALWHGG